MMSSLHSTIYQPWFDYWWNLVERVWMWVKMPKFEFHSPPSPETHPFPLPPSFSKYTSQSGYSSTLPWQYFFRTPSVFDECFKIFLSWLFAYFGVLCLGFPSQCYFLVPYLVLSPVFLYMLYIISRVCAFCPSLFDRLRIFWKMQRMYASHSGLDDKEYRRERFERREQAVSKHDAEYKNKMRRKNRKKKKKNFSPSLPVIPEVPYTSHSGPGSIRFERVYATIGELRKLATGNDSDCDHLMSELEDILLLLICLSECRSWVGFSATLAKHLKGYVKGSATAFVKDLFSDLTPNGYSSQAGDIFDVDIPLWLDQFRFAVSNWKEARNMPAFTHVSRVLSICVAAGICKAADVNIKMGNLTLFAVNTQEKHRTAFDLMDAVTMTVSYFVESGYEAGKTGSLRPFLYDNQDAQKLDEDYMKVRDAMRVFSAGNLELLNVDDTSPNVIVTENDLANAIQSLFRRYGHAKQFVTDGLSKSVVNYRFIEIQEWRMDFLAKSRGGTLREAPYTFLIFGRSAIGKSTIVHKIVRALLCEIGEDHTDTKRIVTINPTDKFVSNAKSDTLAFIFDDMGAETVATAEANPSRRWIDYSNNIRTYALKADVQDKGVTCIQHKIQAGTANFADGGMDAYCNYKVAAARRGTRDMIKLKPEFSLDGKINKRLVNETFGDQMWPDIYDITVYEAIEEVFQNNGEYELVPVKWNGKSMIDVTYEQYADYHLSQCVIHFEDQKATLANNGKANDALTRCDTCKHVICKCTSDVADIQEKSTYETPARTPDKRTRTRVITKTYTPAAASKAVDAMLNDPDYCWHKSNTHKCTTCEASLTLATEFCGKAECPMTQRYESHNGFEERQAKLGVPVEVTRAMHCDAHIETTIPQFRDVMHPICPAERRELREMYARWDLLIAEKKMQKDSKYSSHVGNSLRRMFAWWSFTAVLHYFCGSMNFVEKWLVSRTSAVVMKTLQYYISSTTTYWYRVIPDVCFEWELVIQIRTHFLRQRWTMTLFTINCLQYIALIAALFVSWFYPQYAILSLSLWVVMWLWLAVMMRIAFDVILAREANRHESLLRLREIRRDQVLTYMLGGLAALSAAAWMYRLYYTRNFKSHGNLAPTSIEEVNARDAETSDWATVESTPLPISHKSKSTNADQLVRTIERNLLYVRRVDGMFSAPFCDAVALKGHTIMLPRHMLTKETRKFEFFRKGEGNVGATFTMMASSNSATHIPGSDFAILQGNGGGPFADITDYFPEDVAEIASAIMIYKEKSGTLLQTDRFRPTRAKRIITTDKASFNGYEYSTNVKTFEGMCMAPLISDGMGAAIFGFHLGGETGTPRGCAGQVTKPMIDEAITRYAVEHPSSLQVASEGTMYKSHLGVTYFESEEIHPKSPTRFLESGSNIDVFGSVKGRCKYFSEVVATPIAKLVRSVCSYEQEYAGPDFKSGTAFRDSLVYSSTPSQGVDQSLLDRAFACLKKNYVKLLLIPALVANCRPLTEIEIVSGQDGVRFVDGLKSKTSMGYPINLPKNQFLIDLPPSESHNCPRTLPSMYWKEAARWEAEYLEGRRCYALFRGCLKDEPTKKGKKKVRVFQASPIVLQILIRKYFLPIARLISVNPLLSECAVGINAHGPEWDQLQAHIKKFGSNRILAGDYSKYDLRTPAQFTSAAFRLMIDIAQETGNYTEDDLIIMQGIATDVVYPLMAYNGDLIQLFGSTPSGHNLTVYVNSIVNSLLLRCAYYTIYPDGADFADVCSVSTYGDDFKGSVKPGYKNFNHIAVRDVFETFGVVITMPDKESTPVPYMEDESCDFLKRHNHFFPELGCHVGKLDENSIFKSLVAVLSSKFATTEEQSAMNIDGALGEWFYYGKEHFEMRQKQMIEIAKTADISHMCKKLHKTFDERVNDWHEKYVAPNGTFQEAEPDDLIDVLEQ